MHNFTSGAIFFLIHFSEAQEIQMLHAVLFLIVYLAALLGNLLIITLMCKDPPLQTPLYYFLKNLSFLDFCFISITDTKSIFSSLTNDNKISFLGCVSQVFFFFFLATTEVALLTVMFYDRYVAICHLLRYEIIMNHGACVQMAASSWVSGGLNTILHTTSTFSVPMCGSLIVHQFFFDVPQLIPLACSYNIGELVVIGISLVLDVVCFVLIDISYINIFSTVLRMPSRESRSKAFSTCLPHLLVVTLFIFSGLFAYLPTLPKSPSDMDFLMSMFYIVVPPTVNPFIYILRNKNIQTALRKLVMSRHCLSNCKR